MVLHGGICDDVYIYIIHTYIYIVARMNVLLFFLWLFESPDGSLLLWNTHLGCRDCSW